MAAQNLKEFLTENIAMGLLFFSLMTFAILFMANNSPDALGGTQDILNGSTSRVQSHLLAIEGDNNILLNISAQQDPEVSDLGSKDSVATSYGMMEMTKNFMVDVKLFMGFIFMGTVGQIIVAVFGGLFGIYSLYFIYNWIRGTGR